MKVTVKGKTDGNPYVREHEGELCVVSVLTGDSIEIGIYGEGTRADMYALQAMAMVSLLKKCDKEEREIVWAMMEEAIREKIEE
jgi:transketolase